MKHYLRYAYDFLILSVNTKQHEDYLIAVNEFLEENLKLELHPKKTSARKLSWGIDFCGYIVLPHYTLPRTSTKRRILKKLMQGSDYQALQSYLGYVSHANSFNLAKRIKNLYWINC